MGDQLQALESMERTINGSQTGNELYAMSKATSRIQDGELYSATHLFSSIADTNSAEMVGITGDKDAHLMVLVKAGGKCEIDFEKGTTFTDNGTEVTAVNRNETSSNSATASIYHSPNTDSSGTVFAEDFIPGGGKQNALIGGEGGTRQEYIIEPNSNHVLRVKNTSGGAINIFVKFVWYEE